MMVMKTVDAKEMLTKLRDYCSYEEMAVHVGKGFNTVYGWARGYAKPSLGDYEMLRGLAISKGVEVAEREE